MRVAFLVTHLLGTGHLKRASLLADGFVRAGHEAVVISGGFPAPNASPELATLVQVSPLRSDADFRLLYGENGEATPALFGQRRMEIGESITGLSPDLLITELFPFGRRKLAGEFEAAIEAADGALIYCSIRDILQYPRKDGRAAEAEHRFKSLFDGAFVHGDPALAPLSDSWPLPDELRGKLAYTGYVAENNQSIQARSDAGNGEIIVAAGGGSVGDRLFEAAADAGDETWRLLVGGHDRQQRIDALRARNSAPVIEATRSDFRCLLQNADLAVLQCGYNTALDVIQSGVRTVFVPFEGEGETEQITRATALSSRFGSGLLREQDLTSETLTKAVKEVRIAGRPDFSGLSLDGIANTIALAEKAVAGRK